MDRGVALLCWLALAQKSKVSKAPCLCPRVPPSRRTSRGAARERVAAI